MIYIPLLGALALAAGTIFQKLVLKKEKINIKLYHVLEFSAIVIAMLPIIYFFWHMEAPALQLKNLAVFFLVIVFSIIANLFIFYSVKWEKISNIEPARVLEPLFVILLALVFSFFFEGFYERNLKVLIPALIAGSALVFSHIEKHHLNFNKYFTSAVLGSFFFALELVISRLILDFYSPVSFYFLRSSAILVITLAIFRPKFKEVDRKTSLTVLLVGVIWTIYRVVVYYGYLNYGVMFTTLLLMLGPIFIYIFAGIFLKEKLKWKNVMAAIIIIACVIYAMLG